MEYSAVYDVYVHAHNIRFYSKVTEKDLYLKYFSYTNIGSIPIQKFFDPLPVFKKCTEIQDQRGTLGCEHLTSMLKPCKKIATEINIYAYAGSTVVIQCFAAFIAIRNGRNCAKASTKTLCFLKTVPSSTCVLWDRQIESVKRMLSALKED